MLELTPKQVISHESVSSEVGLITIEDILEESHLYYNTPITNLE
jgi:hypothetical protein